MPIFCIGKKRGQMQTQMLISWLLIPAGKTQHVTCHIYVIVQYTTTASLCKITSFSRSDCRNLVSLEWTFLMEKNPQNTSPKFKTLNLGQAAPKTSYTTSPTNTVTGTCHNFLTKLYKYKPQFKVPGAQAFSCSGSFCCPLSQLSETPAAYKLQFKKHRGKGSLKLKRKKKKKWPCNAAGKTLKMSIELVRHFSTLYLIDWTSKQLVTFWKYFNLFSVWINKTLNNELWCS